MTLGIMALAMIVGTSVAGAALMSGFSVLAALALYSGTGVVLVLAFMAVVALRQVARPRNVGLGPLDFSV